MEKVAQVRSGKTITIVSSGEYSDYCVHAVVRWSSDKLPSEALELYLQQHPKQREDYEFNTSQFVSWLARRGFVEELDCDELWISDYNRHRPNPGFGPLRRHWETEVNN